MREARMLFRFSLYGFLKNQQYYDPFLILSFLAKGMEPWTIGLLVGFREICVNFMEIPTGAVADVLGRRRSMVASFLAYIVAFVIFAFATPSVFEYTPMLAMLFAAMFFFSIGEAFRTGTHKAIIFDWLSRQGRRDEKIRVYGFTRSWSKMGSAVSAVIAPILVIVFRDYSVVFLACVIPYALNIVNFLTYPAYLDGTSDKHAGMRQIVGTLWASLRRAIRHQPLRRLFAESMGFEGAFKVSKDFLQPVLQLTAIVVLIPLVRPIPALGEMDNVQMTALLVGAVYFVLYLLSSIASRHADAFARRAGSERQGARRLWAMYLGAFVVLTAGLLAGKVGLAISVSAFVVLSIIQNFWRPILISRVADHASPAQMATILSIESQAKSLFAAVLAPLLWLSVGAMGMWVGADSTLSYLPVGLLGIAIAVGMLLTGRSQPAEDAS